MPGSQKSAYAAVLLLVVPWCFGQRLEPLRAQGAITVRAVLPATAKLDPPSAYFSAALGSEQSSDATLSTTLELDWNIDRFTRRMQIVARFPNSRDALQDGSGHSITAAQLELSTDKQHWKPFPLCSVESLSSGVLVASEDLSEVGRQGKMLYQISLRLREGAENVYPARYYGALHFQLLLQ